MPKTQHIKTNKFSFDRCRFDDHKFHFHFDLLDSDALHSQSWKYLKKDVVSITVDVVIAVLLQLSFEESSDNFV